MHGETVIKTICLAEHLNKTVLISNIMSPISKTFFCASVVIQFGLNLRLVCDTIVAVYDFFFHFFK